MDVGCWFGDEHEGFVEAEEEAFVGFYGAFYAVHVVVAVIEKVRDLGWLQRRGMWQCEADLIKSFEGVMIFLPESPLKTREMT